MIRLELEVDAACLQGFYAPLEKGVGLSVDIGCSLRDFLCSQLGINADYLDNRIQTLFLDARPVDDVDTAVIKDGATLALSAAMPGLVGATLRKGGQYAAFRQDISQPTDACGLCVSKGRVTLKLFNMVAKEIGGHLLAKGVEVDGRDLEQSAARCLAGGAEIVGKARVDGEPAPADAGLFSALANRQVLLTVLPAN